MSKQKSIVELMGNVSEEDVVIHTDKLYEIPFREVIKNEMEKVNSKGRIFIPVFNRMGMKYWAGCQSDEGYSFTRRELVDILESLNITDYKFLYPYPDYIYPMAIYSDEYLPKKGELAIESYNFEKERLVLFHEAKAYDMIIHENLFPQFSNSFLLVIGSNLEKENTIFTKFSYERVKEFAIKTDIIVMDNDEKVVKKRALYPEGKEHIYHMYNCYKGLSEHMIDGKWKILPCKKDENVLVFPFVNGETLSNILYELVAEERKEELFLQLENYISKIKKMFGTLEFKKTEAFVNVFGNVSFPEQHHYTTSDYNNIDLVLDNVLVDGDGYYFIDYEWTFHFPVPLEYTIYRILHYFILRSEHKQWLEELNLYEYFGISEEEKEIFEEMEQNFQSYIEGNHTPIRDLYEMKGAGRLDIGTVVQAYKKQVQANNVCIYFDYGEGFSENQMITCKAQKVNGICKIEIDIPKDVKAFRIDPVEDFGCLMQICKFEDEQGNSLLRQFVANGKKANDNVYMFATKDPWIKCKKKVEKVCLEYRISVCDDELLKKYDKVAGARKFINKIFR